MRVRGSTAAARLVALALTATALGLAQDQRRQPFDEWLVAVKADALARGIGAATVETALASVEAPDPEVVERDRAQPEQTRTLEDYVAGWLTPRTVSNARTMMARHRRVLDEVSATYGLPVPVLVAVWGLESNFGRVTGNFPTIQALATLAYDPRRPSLFRAELLDALEILDQGVIKLDEMKGSWAGAMGQPQFMPSSYLRHAVDFDGDDRADIWESEADVFASMASYLDAAGWATGERWGREVRISRAALEQIEGAVPKRQRGCGAVRVLTVARPLGEWSSLGVRLAGGAPLPTSTMTASLLRGSRRTFLVYRNYLALLDYNCSNAYATSIGLLSDRLW
jgi:membrane-bound lytic murein transglycosylase B